MLLFVDVYDYLARRGLNLTCFAELRDGLGGSFGLIGLSHICAVAEGNLVLLTFLLVDLNLTNFNLLVEGKHWENEMAVDVVIVNNDR